MEHIKQVIALLIFFSVIIGTAAAWSISKTKNGAEIATVDIPKDVIRTVNMDYPDSVVVCCKLITEANIICFLITIQNQDSETQLYISQNGRKTIRHHEVFSTSEHLMSATYNFIFLFLPGLLIVISTRAIRRCMQVAHSASTCLLVVFFVCLTVQYSILFLYSRLLSERDIAASLATCIAWSGLVTLISTFAQIVESSTSTKWTVAKYSLCLILISCVSFTSIFVATVFKISRENQLRMSLATG